MLRTNNIKESNGNNERKNIMPGKQKVKINNITLEKPLFKTKSPSVFFIMEMESEPIGNGFQGFLVDINDEKKGRHKGKIGKVKYGKWSYSNFKSTRTGETVTMESQILKVIMQLCLNAGKEGIDFWKNSDDKYETLKDMIKDINEKDILKDKYMWACITGREYYNKKGYLAYDLFINKPEYGFKYVSVNEEDVQDFNDNMIEKLQGKSESEVYVPDEGDTSTGNEDLLDAGDDEFDTEDDVF